MDIDVIKSLNAQIEDETNGVTEYGNLIDKVAGLQSIEDSTKEMIVATLNKIKSDEESHKQLLLEIKKQLE